MHLILVGHSKPEETCLEIGITEDERRYRKELSTWWDLGVTYKIWSPEILTGKMVCTCDYSTHISFP
jgi:hypothetical protein